MPIFQYGYDTQMKPKITYHNDGTTSEKSYKIYLTDTSHKPDYELNMPVQKWINFVFNYNDNDIDLFIDGNLERSFTFNENRKMPMYDSFSDNITVGSKNGIRGAISNISYYTKPLTKAQIATNYNIFMTNNAPMTLKI